MKSEVFNIDCMTALREAPDNHWDLACVDPPYGIGADKRNAHSSIRDNANWADVDWDSQTPTVDYFTELFRVSTNQIIWGGNYFLDFLPSTQCFLIWNKPERNFSLADAEIAWTSFSGSIRCFDHPRLEVGHKRITPTQKPVALYKWLLTNYAKPGDTILDTHLGSQSSRIAAWDLGFDFTGFELDEDYFKAGCERFEIHRAQARLFDAPVIETVEQNPLF